MFGKITEFRLSEKHNFFHFLEPKKVVFSSFLGKKLIWGPDIFYNFTDYLKMINNVINITNHLHNNQ